MRAQGSPPRRTKLPFASSNLADASNSTEHYISPFSFKSRMKNPLIHIIILLLVFSSCTAPIEYGSKVKLEGNIWNLSELDGKEYFPDAEHDPAYIEFFSDGRFFGFGACNEFFGKYDASGSSIKIESNMTARGCEGFLEFELDLGSALLTADEYVIKGDELFLYRDSKVIAKFFTVITPELN